MRDEERVKIVVFVPETHADAVRAAMGQAGAGLIGHYTHCSFSIKGIGRFMPLKTAHPTIGVIGNPAEVPEERIETVCYERNLDTIIAAVKKVHPYEEAAIDVYPLLRNPDERVQKNNTGL